MPTYFSSLWTAQAIYPPICGSLRLLFQTIQTLSHEKSTFELVICDDAAQYFLQHCLIFALSQVQLLSAASSTPLLPTVSCTSHYSPGRSCIFTERPNSQAPSLSTHQPLALPFCTKGRSCIFAERSKSIHFCRKATTHSHFYRTSALLLKSTHPSSF